MSFGLLGVGGDVASYGVNKAANIIANNKTAGKNITAVSDTTANVKSDNQVENAKKSTINSTTNASNELNEIMNSEPIKTFTPETASNDIKKLENILIANGADDISRQQTVNLALDIEKTLDGSGKTIRNVFEDISKITSGAVNKIYRDVGKTNNYWNLFSENIKTLSTTADISTNAGLVTEYANAYTQSLKNNNIEKYNSVMLSADGTDLSAELPKTIMQNIIPNNAPNAGEYKAIAVKVKNIITDSNLQLENIRNEIYGENRNEITPGNDNFDNSEISEVKSVTEPKNITLTRMGDFYEVFGDEAIELAEKLNLTPTYKTINGVKTAMVGFPVHVLEKYQSALGDGYNLVISDKTNTTNNQNDTETVTIETTENHTKIQDEQAVSYDKAESTVYAALDKLGLTYDEQGAILEYKSSGSYSLNGALYSGEKLTDYESMLVNNINNALEKFPKYTGMVYRNISFDFEGQEAFDNFIAKHKVGEIISYPSFTSASKTTYGYIVDGDLLVHMDIDSINGYDVSDIGITDEQEILFKTNTSFKVREIRTNDKGINIILEEVNNGTLDKGQNAAIAEFKNNGTNEKTVERSYSGTGNSGELKEVHTGTDTIRGRGSTYDEVYSGKSDGNRGRIESGSQSQDLGSDTEIRNDRNREELSLWLVNSDDTLTDKCTLIPTKHTATGDDIWVVTLKDGLSQEEFRDLSGRVKAVGGYYSRFAKTPDGKAIPGFVFKSEPTAKELSVFNEFFDKTTAEEMSQTDSNETVNKPDLKVGDVTGNNTIKTNKNEEKKENDKSQSEILAGESKSYGRGLQSGTFGSDVGNRVETADGQHREQSGQVLSKPTVDNASGYTDRNDGKGIDGTNDATNVGTQVGGNAVGNERGRRGELHGRGNRGISELGEGDKSGELTDDTSDKTDTETTKLKTKKTSDKDNFVITNDVAAEIDNGKPNAKDNLEAIELLLTLENEGRAATAEEKKILAKYKGWGGIDTRTIPYPLNLKFDEFFRYEEREAMQSSLNNAFFTPTKVIDAMYTGLKRLGFKGGNVLETSMGVGNFFGRMPSVISEKSALTGIELESYTARIAQYLYPGATVINMPFQDVAIKNGSYDLVIGNVPFGQNKISYNKKKYSLHNYFIISSLDKVRDGGIVAVITSAGTLDSHSIDARKAITDRADVVACYKLPEKVFSRNARTDVQSDLLILKKRAGNSKPSGDSILNTVTTKDGLRINEYFEKHPENILGTLAKGKNAWGEITTVLDDGNFYEKLDSAMKKLPKDLISGKTELKPIETIISLLGKPRFFEENGKVYADDGAGTATAVSKKQVNTVRDYMAVRDAYKELLGAYERDLSDNEIEPLRKNLSKVYDEFYEKHGPVTGDGKKKIGSKKSKNNTFLEADADYYLVGGLERYDTKNKEFAKSALFDKDTLRKKKVTSVDFASDALAVSLNESGRIDFARMQELTGKTEKQLAEELKGEIVLTPDGDYVLTDIYLSGNIYEKLEAVKDKAEFKEQREMLEKVIPTPKRATDIIVKLGANYIDTSYIEQFARDVLNSRLTIRKDVSGRWVIEEVKRARYGDVVNVKYGCGAFNAVQLLEKILNDSEIAVTKKVETGGKTSTAPDLEMTDIAKQKADDIRNAFENWIFADSNRRNDIVDKYNRIYNNYKPIDYGHIAEKLSFDSMDETLKSKLYPHQKKGIARFLFGGNTLFAHGVGTGKTFEMIASVMEAKRMGVINKAAMVVPNNKVVDFKRDIAQAYPNAKVLVIDTANKKRQTMLGLINSNDWDIILIARTTFTKIPVSRELQAHYVAQQLEDIEIQIDEAERDKNVSNRQLKSMIMQKNNYERKFKDLNSDTNRDKNSVDFEKLGIDCICVDEAHNYKSIVTPTKLNIKGLVNRNNAQLANDMLMKLDYLRSVDGKIIFGTGTPITNTVSEIYNMMRMVRPDILEDAGIHSLDEWVNTFAKIETTTEIGIDNKIKNKPTQIIRNFVNVSEMVGMFRQFADIVFTKDVVKNLPKEKYIDIKIDGREEHRKIQRQISKTLATAKKSEMLKVHGQLMSMADAGSVDLRMLSGAKSEYNIFKDYSVDELEYENSKINVMCNKVYEEYTSSNDIRGTQIIFCDKGSGSGLVYSFNLHKDIMQKLIERGIPKEQIVIVKNQSDAQLEQLYEKVNDGEVRVLIGTSQKMAEGLNVQKRVVAIHHPTVTYKPSDWEQGNARGVRAGNINDEVRIYRYLQENTFDSHKWQAQDRKGEMINKALRGELVGEIEDIGADEDGGASIDAATAMAITSGNPLVKEKIDIDKEVTRLKTLQRNYMNEIYRYQDSVAKNPNLIRQYIAYADNIERDIELRDKYTEKSVITIKNKNFEKQTVANKALSEAVKLTPKNGQYSKIGVYNDFDIMFKGDTGGMNYSLVLKGFNEYSVDYADIGNNIARFAGVLGRLDAELTRVRGKVDTLKNDLEFAKQEVNKPFEKETELAKALEKQKDITYRYEHYGEKSNTDTDTDSNIHYSLDSRNGSNQNNTDIIQNHTPEQIKIMEEYENAVDSILLNFVKYAREHKNDNRTTITLSKVSDRCANDIKALTGVDVTNFEHSIKVNTIRHIDDGHGINGDTDHSMADDKDIARIQYVIDNYDDIELLDDKSKEYRDKNQKPAPMIKLSKRIDGTYYVVEAVPDTKKHQLPIISAYKNKAVEQQALIMQKENLLPQLHAQDVVADTTSDESVSQNDDNVKNKNTHYSLKSDNRDLGNSKNNGKIKKTHEIVSYLSEVFDVPISVGNLQYSKAKGQYKDFEKSIRVKIANDLRDITHELGHLLADKYDLQNSKYADEALDFAEQNNPQFMKLYQPELKLDEAIAEFTREFLKNPQKVQKEVPNFYEEFVAKLDKADTESLKQASEYIQDYFNSDFRTRVEAATITKKEIKKLEKGNVTDKMKELYVKLVDDLAPINDVMNFVKKTTGLVYEGNNNAYEMAMNSRNANSITRFLFEGGMIDSNGNIINDKSFMKCIAEIKSENIKDFDNYLILKHSVEWLEPKAGKIKQVFTDETLQDIERIKKEITAYENEYPQFERAAENLYEFQRDMLRYWLVETGGMSEELFAELQKRYPCYVPFKRYMGKKSYGGVKSTFANRHTPIARAKGSGATIISPLESIINNINHFVKFGVENKTMSVLTDYADNVAGFAKFLEEVPPDKIRHTIGITRQTEQLKNVMSGLNEPDFLELSEALDDIFGNSVSSYTPVAKASKQIVTCMSGGEYRYFQVHDKALYDAVANMTPRQVENFKIFGKMLNATNLLITQYNYLFGVKNPIRDFDTALKHSKAYNNLGDFTVAYFTALRHIFTNSDEYKQYQAVGGGHMSRLSDSIDIVKKALNDVAVKDEGKAKRIAYAIFRHPIETLISLNEITETIPRLAEFEGIKKQGKDNQKAIYEANDVTTNFSRSGDIGRAINKAERFSNAQVQGLDKEIRTFSTGGKKSILRYIMRYLISALLTSAFIEFWNRTVDEDGWDELAKYQKNNFYCIAKGDGKFIKIPKAREAAIPNTFTERCIDLAFGDKDAFYQFGEYIGDTILPSWLPIASLIGGTMEGGVEQGAEDALHQVLGSTIIGGLYDNAVNKDFKGTPIVPKSMEDIPSKQQTDSKTTYLGYRLGQILNMSPLKADHIIDSYTGILGKVNRAFGVMDRSQTDKTAGFRNTFITDSTYSTDVFNKVYDKRDKLSDKFAYKSTSQNACLYEKYASLASFITKSNRIIKSLPQDKQRAVKQKLIDDVKSMNMSISNIDKSVVKSIKGNVTDEYCIKTLPSEVLTYTEDGKSYSYTMTYDEYKKYATDYINTVNQKRKEQISTNKYAKANTDDKIEMLKDAKSDAGKEVKKDYVKKLKKKFKQSK